jgi:hypothetical protein
VSFANVPPRTMYLSQAPVRHPRVQVLSDKKAPLSDVPVTITVSQISLARNPQVQSVDCSSDATSSVVGTLEGWRLQDVCRAVLGQETVMSDDIGLGSFVDFSVVRGPPGIWDLTFSAGNQSVVASVNVFSAVMDTLIMTPEAPSWFVAGVPLSTQPVLKVVDQYGNPVSGRVVVAFVSQSPFDSDDSTLVEGHDLQGQRYGVLKNAMSLPSDDNGLANFTSLTIMGTSSSIVYLSFYCEGVITSWSVSGGSSEAQKFGNVLPSLPSTVLGIQVSTTVCGVSIVRSPPPMVKEGEAFSIQPQVLVTDSSGRPLSNKVRCVQQLFSPPNMMACSLI